jgi:hypothetical protein
MSVLIYACIAIVAIVIIVLIVSFIVIFAQSLNMFGTVSQLLGGRLPSRPGLPGRPRRGDASGSKS